MLGVHFYKFAQRLQFLCNKLNNIDFFLFISLNEMISVLIF